MVKKSNHFFGLNSSFFNLILSIKRERKPKFSITCVPTKLSDFGDDDYIAAHRLVYSKPKKYSREMTSFHLKYKNFMYSPKSHFVYKTVKF